MADSAAVGKPSPVRSVVKHEEIGSKKMHHARIAAPPHTKLKQEAAKSYVGQDGILPRIGNPPGVGSGITYGPIANRTQVVNGA